MSCLLTHACNYNRISVTACDVPVRVDYNSIGWLIFLEKHLLVRGSTLHTDLDVDINFHL